MHSEKLLESRRVLLNLLQANPANVQSTSSAKIERRSWDQVGTGYAEPAMPYIQLAVPVAMSHARPPIKPTAPCRTASVLPSAKVLLKWNPTEDGPGKAPGLLPTVPQSPADAGLCWGGPTASSFPDTAIPLWCRADVNSPSAAR